MKFSYRKIEKKKNLFANLMILTLSLASGYSQSMSKPLNPYFSKYSKQLAIKLALNSGEAAIGDKIAFPAFHPPTLIIVFKSGLVSFKASSS